MKARKFFEERSDQSEVKARIVTKYFIAWAKVVMPTTEKHGGKIAYVDLYAGPGRYKDGAASTPLLVLQAAIKDPKIAQMLVSYFNDSKNENTATLQEEINKLPGVEKLTYKPITTCGEVDDEAARYFEKTRLIPSFSFIDPFGYKGLSLKIIKGVIKDWGCDCVFFFNYNRINAGIGNQFVAPHMERLFGEVRAGALRAKLLGLTPELREATILEELTNEIRRVGGKYVLPFTFKNTSGTRTSHKLIFASKNFRGYSIMKSIMARESSTRDEGIPSFSYSPADASTPLLFSLAQPLSKLKQSMLDAFAGQEINLKQIYGSHSIDTSYVERNYREVLKQLENEGTISVRSTKGKRRPGTFAEHVLINFPVGGNIGR